MDLTQDIASVTSVPSSMNGSSPTPSSDGPEDAMSSGSSDSEFAIPDDMSSASSDTDEDNGDMSSESNGPGSNDMFMPIESPHTPTASDLPDEDTEELVSQGHT